MSSFLLRMSILIDFVLFHVANRITPNGRVSLFQVLFLSYANFIKMEIGNMKKIYLYKLNQGVREIFQCKKDNF